MRIVPQWMTDVWKSGDFTGDNKPTARVTIQRTSFTIRDYGKQRYASYLFGNSNPVVELPTVRQVTWSRSVETDAGTCQVGLWNAMPLGLGQRPDPADMTVDQPGFFTFNRGSEVPNPWNHVATSFHNKIHPDQILRTYEGYGVTPSASPDDDPRQLPSGVWLIDDVTLSTDGSIQLNCRDATRLLLDQIIFPPVIPFDIYPLSFDKFHQVDRKKVPKTVSGGSHGGDTGVLVRPDYNTDSGVPYYGSNGTIYGHRPSDAMDGGSPDASYWLSVGNASPRADYAYEYVEGTIAQDTVSGVRVHVKGGPYRMYVSVYADPNNDGHFGWQGHAVVAYNPKDPVSAPNGANIKFVKHTKVEEDEDLVVGFTGIKHAKRVRITFHHLWNSGLGKFPYRAAVRDFQVVTGDINGGTGKSQKTVYVTPTPAQKWVGNYGDYTDIVKFLLAYGGFYWPYEHSVNFLTNVAGVKTHMVPGGEWVNPSTGTIHHHTNGDPVLYGQTPDKTLAHVRAGDSIGAIWGDLEQSGTFGDVALTPDVFDKQPVMDGIAYVRDMLGFIFFVDETGAAIFRSGNVWKLGNYLIDPEDSRTVARVSPGDDYEGPWCVTIHEKQTLIGLQASLTSREVRERIVIANLGGDFGAVTKGFKPYDLPRTGMRRVAIWSDQHFKSDDDCQIMADLIAVRALFMYRTDKVTVTGYPAIQVDDQIKLVESFTEEGRDVHYVKGITSTLSHDTGQWQYEIDTHWLGDQTYGRWAFDPSTLDPKTQSYLNALGRVN